MNISKFKLYDAAIKDLLKLKKSIGEKEFNTHGYNFQLENYRVEAQRAIEETP